MPSIGTKVGARKSKAIVARGGNNSGSRVGQAGSIFGSNDSDNRLSCLKLAQTLAGGGSENAQQLCANADVLFQYVNTGTVPTAPITPPAGGGGHADDNLSGGHADDND